MRSDELINAIKLNSFIPISQYTLKDEDLLGFCDREIELSVLPALLEHREEYLVFEEMVPITAGKSAYPIPYRAVGHKLRALFYTADNGNTLVEMSRIGYDQRTEIVQGSTNNSFFFLRGNDVVITNKNLSGHLIFAYYLKPNKLVLPEEVGYPIAIHLGQDLSGAVDSSKTTIEFASMPESLALGKVDFMEGRAGFRTFAFDKTPTATSDTKLEFLASDVPDTFTIEDYVAIAKQCIYPQIPEDLHTLLVEQVSQRALKALGDQQGYQLNEAKIQKYENNIKPIASNRVESSPQKIVNRNGLIRNTRRFSR